MFCNIFEKKKKWIALKNYETNLLSQTMVSIKINSDVKQALTSALKHDVLALVFSVYEIKGSYLHFPNARIEDKAKLQKLINEGKAFILPE